MKILHVTTDFPYIKDGKIHNYGGLGLCVTQLIEGLKGKGIEIDVLSRSESGIERELFEGVYRAPYIKLSNSRNWKLTHALTLIPKLIRLIKDNKYDIIHVHNPPAGWGAIPVARFFKIKTVMTMHGPWSRVRERMSGFATMIENDTLKVADAVTFDSHSLLDMYPYKDKYFAIENAVDGNVFKPHDMKKARETLMLDPKKRIFLYSGRNVYGKNIDTIRSIAGKFPKDIFLVTGWEGNATDEEFSNLQYMGAVSNVDMPMLYSACNGLILASEMEGMSRAVLEAMACERAVILSNIPANRETAGDYGLYFKDRTGLEDILTIAKPIGLSRMGKLCRKRVLENYGISNRIEKFIRLYNHIL